MILVNNTFKDEVRIGNDKLRINAEELVKQLWEKDDIWWPKQRIVILEYDGNW